MKNSRNWFFVITMAWLLAYIAIFFNYSNRLIENEWVLIGYIVLCIVGIVFMYRLKKTKRSRKKS